MKLNSTLTLYGGGPGSGCHGPNCGRPASYRPSSAIGKIHAKLSDGEWHTREELQPLAGTTKLSYRLHILSKHGADSGQWRIESGPNGLTRMVLTNAPPRTSSPPPISLPRIPGAVPPPLGTTLYSTIENIFQTAAGSRRPLPYQVRDAINVFVRHGADPRLFTTKPLASISVGRAGHRNYLAWYTAAFRSITFNRSQINNTTSSTFIHEFGHHLDITVTQGRNPWRSNNIDDQVFDAKKLQPLRDGMLAEFQREQSRITGLTGRGPAAWPRVGSNTSTINSQVVRAPSAYAVTNDKEWFAESFRAYFNELGMRPKLEREQPATFRYIDDLVRGKLFKE